MKYKCLEKLNNQSNKEHKVFKFLNKILMAVLLGLVMLIVMEYSPKFKKFMHDEVLGNNISFAYLGNLYQKYFGEVLPEKKDNVIPVFNEKITYLSKEKYQDGYKLMVSNNYLVPVITSGIVVFIGEKDNIGKVITIEGEDNTTITYGNINSTEVKLYDKVEKGKFLGEVNGDTFYLTILKNGEEEDIETYLS